MPLCDHCGEEAEEATYNEDHKMTLCEDCQEELDAELFSSEPDEEEEDEKKGD